MYKCKFCDKEFFFEGKLKRHLLFNHPAEPEDSDLYVRIRDQISSELRDRPPTFTHRMWVDEYLRIFGIPTRQRRSNVQLVANPNMVEDLSVDWAAGGNFWTIDTEISNPILESI